MRSIVLLLLSLLAGLVGCDGGGYKRKGAAWIYDEVAFMPQDTKTLEPIDKLFARDVERGYYRGGTIPDSDGRSFQVLSDHEARDARAVYYCDTYRKAQEYWAYRYVRITEIAGADAATYTALGKSYARDRSRVYLEGVPRTVRDPSTFVPMEAGFTRDAQRGYFRMVEIAASDGASFRVIDERDGAYVRDKNSAYHGHIEVNAPNKGPHPVLRRLADADLDALRVLGQDYASDGRRVWHNGAALVGADAGTFVVNESSEDGSDAHDGSKRWLRGAKVPTRAASASSK